MSITGNPLGGSAGTMLSKKGLTGSIVVSGEAVASGEVQASTAKIMKKNYSKK